jgi:hypothetical protein
MRTELFRMLAARVAAWPWRELARNTVGLAGLGLIVAGVWGLGGWEWGAISAGLPIGGFYVLGVLRSLRPREEV